MRPPLLESSTMLLRRFIQKRPLQCFANQTRKLANASFVPTMLNNALRPHPVPRSKVEFLAKMLFMPSQSPPDSRLLKVAVVGFPNVGKSSLVNMLVSWRVCAVSGKAHTTRSKQTVVFTKDNIQLAFVDLPGLVSARQIRQFKLERTFIRDPHAAIFDADLVLVVVDASNKYARKALDLEVLKVLHFFADKESVLVLNKVDKSLGDRTRLLETTRRLTGGLDALSADGRALTTSHTSNNQKGVGFANEEERLEGMLERVRMQMMLNSASKEEVALRRQKWRELSIRLQGVKHWGGFSQVFMVSAATGEGIDKLRNYLLERAKPDRQWILSPSLVTDVEPSELIRMSVWAHCLDQLPKEIPYGLVVTVDECEHVRQAEGDDRVYVHVRLRCPNERIIKYVVGAEGKRIRAIASAVKQELSSLFQAPTVVKLAAEVVRPTHGSMRRMRAAEDFAEVFPNFDNGGGNGNPSQHAGIESAQV
ncbi:GTPase Era mitochondrial [Taenia solium]|eukprot:TsM_000701900 transcript=TsM_000701900 gene=TsM_000701900